LEVLSGDNDNRIHLLDRIAAGDTHVFGSAGTAVGLTNDRIGNNSSVGRDGTGDFRDLETCSVG
jgi:hypothetical protein